MIGHPKELISWLLDQPADSVFTVKERKRKRSLTQNAYYWSLLNQLARVLGYPDDEVHRTMLATYGVCEVFSVREDVPLKGYFRYYDVIGTGQVNGRLFKHVRVWKGSSEMDSKEFSHLLDGMRQECQAQGIPVMTPEETAQLKWIGEK